MEVVRDTHCLYRMDKATKPRKEEFREPVGTIIERTLTGEAGMETDQGQNR